MQSLNRRKILSASAINGGGFLLASAIALLWSFLVVRLYPGEASGQLLLALSVAGLINLLDLGASLGLIRVISASGDTTAHAFSASSYFHAALRVTTFTELVLGSLAVLIWNTWGSAGLSLLAACCVVVFAISTQATLLSASALKGVLDFKSANLVTTGTTLSVYGAGVVAMLCGQDVWFVLLAMTITQSIAAPAAVILTSKRVSRFVIKNNRISVEQPIFLTYLSLLRASVALFPQMFTGIFFMHAQRFLIARYAGIDAVALVSLAYSVATRLHAVVNAFLEVIFPMARQIKESGVTVGAFCLKVGILSAVVYMVAVAVAIVVGALAMPAVVPVLLVFALGVTFAVATAPAFHLLNGSGEGMRVSIYSLMSPVIFLFLVPLLHLSLTVPDMLLLPVSYVLTMILMLVQVTLHIRRQSMQQRHI